MPPFRIELRSDTQTTPTEEMREAMARAEVGDDQAGEDPTVRELEDLAAELFRKEAALFVTSGTMGNLVSLLTLTNRGDSLLVDPESHVTLAEAGGFATLAGCSVIPIQTPGWLTPEDIEPYITPVTTHSLNPGVIWTENTHNRRGGVAWGPDVMRKLASLAGRHGLRLHIDGARIFNAAAALDGFGGGPGRRRRHRAVLSLQGTWRALRIDDRGIKRTDPAGTPNPPTRWRRHAAGRRRGGGGPHCSDGTGPRGLRTITAVPSSLAT